MAKSIRSKVKKRHRTYIRATIGEKVRTSNIEAAAARLTAKMEGRANTHTLVAMKGALQRPDLGAAYYEAVVRPSREAVIEDVDMAEEEDEEPARVVPYVVPKSRRSRAKLGVVTPRRRRGSSLPPKKLATF